MGEADYRALRLCPLQNGQVPGRPVFDHFSAGIVLVFETQQNQMAAVARRESGYFQVVTHQVLGGREPIYLRFEELFLMIIAGSPGQDCADIETLTENMSH